MASNMRLTPLADLKPFKTGWKVHVKVLHTWKQYQTKSGESLEIILAEEMGTKIHATVKKNMLHHFERMMVVGEWKFIENFALNQASGQYRATKHQFKMSFIASTVVSKSANRSDSERQITSSFQTSKVLIDLNDSYVIDFKNSLLANGGNSTFLSSKPHQRISYDDESNFDQLSMVTIAELQDYLEIGKCKIMCTVYAVDTDWSWFYLIQDPNVVPDALQNLVGKNFQFLICVEKKSLYDGSNTYKVGKVWKDNQVFTTTVDEVNESEDGGDHSLLMSGNQASLMNTHSQESSDDVTANIKTLLSKRERDDPKDSVDSSSSSKKSCNSLSSVETTYANEVIDEDTLKSDSVLVNTLLTSEYNESIAKG
ncbi:uncharacterized protein LOC112089296 [Eutrema salsugineum]|uniref:uncharacterized protein LOC112089296 n=1 Tax=Eutrema salsugineum TaxID=72664 RepID=UPI000CECFC94|nr:uncharacterized protein LOC112089296 [Eutrema salsugineum]